MKVVKELLRILVGSLVLTLGVSVFYGVTLLLGIGVEFISAKFGYRGAFVNHIESGTVALAALFAASLVLGLSHWIGSLIIKNGKENDQKQQRDG